MAHPHLEALLVALDAERRCAAAEHARLLAQPWSDRVATGVSWPPLRLEAVREGGAELDLRASGGADLHDGITSGEPVRIGPMGAPDQGLDGVAIDPEGPLATVRLLSDTDGAPPPWLEGELAVSRRFDPSTFERYAAALQREGLEALPLAQALLGELDVELPADRHPLPSIFSTLNDAQRAAASIARAASPLAAIHGPPGTGKTTLIVALLQAWVGEAQRPLALADSNAAVDHLALAADARGLDVLRLGSRHRIGAAARRLSVDARMERGPYQKALELLQRDIDRAFHKDDWREARGLIRQRRGLRQQAWQHAVESAQVLACTLGSLPRVLQRLPPLDVAVVDEATQAIEPAIWGAVPAASKLVLVGDPCQLGPVLIQPGNPLQRSLLERLLDEGRVPMPMLEVQHRMHADIQHLVQSVYGPRYRPHPSVAAHLLGELPGVDAAALPPGPTLWVDTAGAGLEEARDPVTLSTYNRGEVDLIEIIAKRALGAGLSPEQLGVITPYSAQVSRIKPRLPAGVEVASVNAFQGREKELILVSWVRSNPDGELGFVADPRRLTVALTRARRGLILVGDSATLGRDPRFAELNAAMWEAGAVAPVWEAPWSAVLG